MKKKIDLKKKILKRKFTPVRKSCFFCKNGTEEIDYKNLMVISKYLNSKGKITSVRVNGNCAKHQRKISKEIKRAQFLALLPYV